MNDSDLARFRHLNQAPCGAEAAGWARPMQTACPADRTFPAGTRRPCSWPSRFGRFASKSLQIGCLVMMLAAASLRASVYSESWSFNNINTAIPDGTPSGLSDLRTISSLVTSISAVTVTLNISGEFNGDLYGYLQHSSGFCVLLNRVGRTGSDSHGYDNSGFSVTLSGTGSYDVHLYQNYSPSYNGSGQLTGTWQPDGRNVDPGSALDTDARTATFNSFNGLNAAGDWTLYFADTELGGTNMLNSWTLNLEGVPEPVNCALIVFGCLAGTITLARKYWPSSRPRRSQNP